MTIKLREFTPEQRDRWKRSAVEALAERSEMDLRLQRCEAAAAEPTFSGALRRAIHQGPKPLPAIAREAGCDKYLLADFLEGSAPLPSDVIDRLVEALGLQLQSVECT